MCIFYASCIYHKVARFIPHTYTFADQEENLTPGRIGSVFFFPKDSFDILEGKERGWGRKTNFGRNEHLIPARSS